MSEKVFTVFATVMVCVSVLGSCFFGLNFWLGMALCVVPGVMAFAIKA